MWSIRPIFDVNWLEIAKAAGPIATAVVASLALKNWKRQDKAKREAEFIDALMEAAHTYIAEVSKPIIMLEMAKIGIESHVPRWEKCDDAEKTVKGAVAYIEKNGRRTFERLSEALESVQPSAIKLRALVAKGQVFNFNSYSKCQRSIAILTHHFDSIAAFAAVIGSTTWNWDNPDLQQTLGKVMALDPGKIRESVAEENVTIIEFARDAYKRIYG